MAEVRRGRCRGIARRKGRGGKEEKSDWKEDGEGWGTGEGGLVAKEDQRDGGLVEGSAVDGGMCQARTCVRDIDPISSDGTRHCSGNGIQQRSTDWGVAAIVSASDQTLLLVRPDQTSRGSLTWYDGAELSSRAFSPDVTWKRHHKSADPARRT